MPNKLSCYNTPMPNKRSTLNQQPSTELISNELKFLIACCQTDPSKDDINFIHSYLNTPAQSDDSNTIHYSLLTTHSAQKLIALASRHGILPLVYKTIKNLEPPCSSLPATHCPLPTLPLPTLINELKAHYQTIARRNMLMSAELIRIIQLLEKNSIEALAFKGPTLSQMAYGDITLRQYVDLDVLTRKKDIYKIDALLKAEGYERLLNITPVQEKVYIQYAHDIGLIHPKKGIHFEMHWSFLDEDYPMQVDLEDFWKETQEVKLNGHPVPTFSNENLLYYLCIHGSKHLWERIEWIKDLDLMIRNETIDWGIFITKTEGSGFEKMVYLGLSLSASLFETSLPQNIQHKIPLYPQINTVSTFILESWQMPKSTSQKTSAMLKLFPGIKEQIIYLHKIICKPSFNEYWYVDLPKGFYWGYYLVRPYLLIKKYFTRKQKNNS